MLFKETKLLEKEMDDFLDIISESVLVFREGIERYLKKQDDDFESSLKKIKVLENRADDLRRDIENRLYTKTLIPESRGDVLGLLENIDKLVNRAKYVLTDFSIEMPMIPTEYHAEFIELADAAARGVEELVQATRRFLSDPLSVKATLHKVSYYEEEADRIAKKIKHKVFRSELDLAQKNHIRHFIINMDSMADKAEDVADRLAIYTIKRSM
jgi:predicted phosphate transport protein (TIGR00153 family)